METPVLPKYVNYGGLTTVPSPFQSIGTTLYAFILEADLDKLRQLCKQVFYDTSQGQVEYVPLSRFVMMTVGNIEQIIPASPYDQIGYSSEGQVAFWIFTAAVKRVGNALIAERPAVFVPYIFVHNAFSFACGREVEGYPKSWGWFDFPEAANSTTPPPPLENFTLDIWGLKEYKPTAKVERTRFMEINQGEPVPGEETHTPWNTLEEAFADVKDLLFDSDQNGTIVLPGLQMAENLFEDLVKHQLPEVYLKQYRDVRNANDACYQAIVELPNVIKKFAGMPVFDKYNVKFEEVASHPITQQLGLNNQEAVFSFWLKMDFVVEDGKVIWQAPTGEAPGCLPGFLAKLLGK